MEKQNSTRKGYDNRKVSIFEKRKIKRTVEDLCLKLNRPPFPKYKFMPELYWLDLCYEERIGVINEAILERVISDISIQLSIQDKIQGHRVIYHNLDAKEYYTMQIPEYELIRVENGIVILEIYTAKLTYDISSWGIIGDEILFALIYALLKFALQDYQFSEFSEYLVHVAFFFFGFGNYAFVAPLQYFVKKQGSFDLEYCIWGFDDWSDAGAIREICHN